MMTVPSSPVQVRDLSVLNGAFRGALDCSCGGQVCTNLTQLGVKAGWAYVVLDGTLIPVDRVAADRPFYSGKHRKHGMNLQVIASPVGDILWVSGALPGAVHDKKAEWVWGVLGELEAAGLVTLADKGYRGSSHAKIPYIGKSKPESQKQANRAHARLRAPGERANAQLKTWRILRKLRCCPWRAGQLAKAIHVLQVRDS